MRTRHVEYQTRINVMRGKLWFNSLLVTNFVLSKNIDNILFPVKIAN